MKKGQSKSIIILLLLAIIVVLVVIAFKPSITGNVISEGSAKKGGIVLVSPFWDIDFGRGIDCLNAKEEGKSLGRIGITYSLKDLSGSDYYSCK
ncbi:MAG: hypothetical protein KJ718_04460 [Nanoarchaeota archaeon]|nr:hypothetical protein [Nanoarchaeota archaeon]MBU1051781.1 hypothetical protein [Nanoarchaeota archaeon]